MARYQHRIPTLVVLWCLFVNVALTVTAEDLGDDQVQQQSDADPIEDDEFLWFTAILRFGNLRCGASWIGGRFVLTAAHCVDGVERSVFADVGYFCADRDNCGRKHQVIDVVDVAYLPSSGADFALLTLEMAPCPDIIKADPAVPDLEGSYLKRLKKNPELVLVGGGRTETGGGPSNVVQKLVADYVSPKSCRKMGIAKAKKGFFCSISRKGDTAGPCAGDSGGPLVVPGRRADKGRDVVVAVHSFGRRVCGAVRRKPDGHFSVSRAQDLIRSKVCVLDSEDALQPPPPDWCGIADSRAKAPTTMAPSLSPVAVTGPVEGEEVSSLAFGDGFLNSVAYNPTGRANQIASGGVFGARVWDSTNLDKSQVYTFLFGEVHTGWVNSIVYSSDGSLLASASDDMTLKVWDPVNLNGKPNLVTLSGHTDVVYRASFDPTDKNRLASVSADSTALLWDVETGSVLRTFADGHGESAVRAVCFGPDGSVLATGGDDGTIVLWNVATGEALQTLSGHTGVITDVCFSPDGTLIASASRDVTVRIWNAKDGTARFTFGLIAFFNGHASAVNAVSWHPNNRYVASGSSDGGIKIWNAVEGGPALLTLGSRSWSIADVSWSWNGRLIAAASTFERTVVQYEVRNLP